MLLVGQRAQHAPHAAHLPLAQLGLAVVHPIRDEQALPSGGEGDTRDELDALAVGGVLRSAQAELGGSGEHLEGRARLRGEVVSEAWWVLDG